MSTLSFCADYKHGDVSILLVPAELCRLVDLQRSYLCTPHIKQACGSNSSYSWAEWAETNIKGIKWICAYCQDLLIKSSQSFATLIIRGPSWTLNASNYLVDATTPICLRRGSSNLGNCKDITWRCACNPDVLILLVSTESDPLTFRGIVYKHNQSCGHISSYWFNQMKLKDVKL